MTITRKNFSLGILFGAALAVIALSANFAHANPSNISSPATGTMATSTALAYLTPGTATTTTPVYDSNQVDGTNEKATSNTFSTDSAVFAMQVNASTTATNYNIAFEYSNGSNCGAVPAGCDWYADTLFAQASTSPSVSLNTSRTFSWLFASSTVGGAGSSAGLLGINGTNNRSTRVWTVATPMRYVRAVISVTGANGAVVEAAFIPKKESK